VLGIDLAVLLTVLLAAQLAKAVPRAGTIPGDWPTIPPTFLQTVGEPGTGSGQLVEPVDVMVNSRAGIAYVSDFGNGRIQLFSLAGRDRRGTIRPRLRHRLIE
jgi:hypothetical protein